MVTKVQPVQDSSKYRDDMVEALNKAIGTFTSYNEDNFGDMMANGILPIANASGLDRVCIYKYMDAVGAARRKRRVYSFGGRTFYRAMKIVGEMHLNSVFCWTKLGSDLKKNDDKEDGWPDNHLTRLWVSKLSSGGLVRLQLSDVGEEELAFLNEHGIKSMMGVPIFSRGDFWGFVTLQDHAVDRSFDSACLDLLVSASRLIAQAYIHAEFEADSSEADKLNRVLAEKTPIGWAMFDEQCNIIDCNSTVLGVFGFSKKYFIEHFFELSPELQSDGAHSKEKMQELMKRALNGETLSFRWTHCSSSNSPIPCEITLSRTTQNGKTVGLSYLYDLRYFQLTDGQLRPTESRGSRVTVDAVTGIYDRSYFDENLARLAKSLSRSDGTLTLMLVDIDCFKIFNDTYGHSAGDFVLKSVADALCQSVTRVDDFVARYSGTEFVVVLPNTDEEGARLVVYKMLESVRDRNMPHENNYAKEYVTISIGVTTGKVALLPDANDFVKRADEMLYISRRDGRDRCTFGQIVDGGLLLVKSTVS